MFGKRMIIFLGLVFLILSTTLFALMIKSDEIDRKNNQEKLQQARDDSEMSWPKVEIETRN